MYRGIIHAEPITTPIRMRSGSASSPGSPPPRSPCISPARSPSPQPDLKHGHLKEEDLGSSSITGRPRSTSVLLLHSEKERRGSAGIAVVAVKELKFDREREIFQSHELQEKLREFRNEVIMMR